MYRSIRTSSSPEPYVKVLENTEVQVPRRPCGTRGPIGGKWLQNVENTELRCVFFQVVLLFFLPWQTGLFWIPVISESNFTNNYRIPRVSNCGDFQPVFYATWGIKYPKTQRLGDPIHTATTTIEVNLALLVVQAVQSWRPRPHLLKKVTTEIVAFLPRIPYVAVVSVRLVNHTLHQGRRTFLRARARIVYKFRRNSFASTWEFLIAK